MIGLPNPYVVLGGVGVLLAATTGAFFEGKHVANGEAAQSNLTQLTNALNDRDAKQRTINQLETAAKQRENDRQSTVREIYHEQSTIVERPVYKNVCVDADGVRLLDRAQTAAAGDAGDRLGQPAGAPAQPAQGPAHH